MKNKAFFFDRDGVINHRLVGDYVKTIQQFIIFPDIPQILKQIKLFDFKLILITNQQGVGKGLMSANELDNIHDFMQEQLYHHGAKFDDIYSCTDLADSKSYRRKPNPGMILEAIEKWNIDPKLSFMIGDSDSDILAGRRAGVRTILVSDKSSNSEPDYNVRDISELKLLVTKILHGDINA